MVLELILLTPFLLSYEGFLYIFFDENLEEKVRVDIVSKGRRPSNVPHTECVSTLREVDETTRVSLL